MVFDDDDDDDVVVDGSDQEMPDVPLAAPLHIAGAAMDDGISAGSRAANGSDPVEAGSTPTISQSGAQAREPEGDVPETDDAQGSKTETEQQETTVMPPSYPADGKILPAYPRAPPVAHPGDDDPLLMSAVPRFPTDAELQARMTAPPLSYLEARATLPVARGEDGRAGLVTRYPARVFCEVCGYWGRVRCIKCGTRVCALDCLDLHREECITRYGL